MPEQVSAALVICGMMFFLLLGVVLLQGLWLHDLFKLCQALFFATVAACGSIYYMMDLSVRRRMAPAFDAIVDRAQLLGFRAGPYAYGRTKTCRNCWHVLGELVGHGERRTLFCPDCGHVDQAQDIVDIHSRLGHFEEHPFELHAKDIEQLVKELRDKDRKHEQNHEALLNAIKRVPGGMQRLEGNYRVAPALVDVAPVNGSTGDAEQDPDQALRELFRAAENVQREDLPAMQWQGKIVRLNK